MKENNIGDREALKKRLYLSRSCGDCNVCCTLLPVESLKKPAGKTCEHHEADRKGGGCTIYETRPSDCREWACVWRSGSNLLSSDVRYRPDQLGIMIDTMRQLPGKPQVECLLIYETRPEGFADSMDILQQLGKKWACILMGEPRALFGPEEKRAELLKVISLDELP